jgi:hypothetical protein
MQPTSTLIDCRSSVAFDSYAVRSLIRRAFPPERLKAAVATGLEEILHTITTGRRHRTCPRVVKRHFANYHKIKRTYDVGIRHDGPPKIHIYGLSTLT